MKSQYIPFFACFCLLCAHTVWSQADDTPSYGDTIIVGSIADASNLIPMLASDSASHDISGLIYNGLVKYDKDLNLVGDLAESWEVSPNGLTITFHLRRGGALQDDSPFTAEDVIEAGFTTHHKQ